MGAGRVREEAASPSPSRGGDVRGYGGIWRLTKPREWSLQAVLEGGDVLKKGGVVSLLTASLSLESDLVKPLWKEGMC